MSATKFGAVASALQTRLQTITGLKVYTYEPRDLELAGGVTGVTPGCAATITGPVQFLRHQPDTEGDSQIGALDWHQTWTVSLYVALEDRQLAEDGCRALLGQAVAALDADTTLGGQALDAAVVNAERGVTEKTAAGTQLQLYTVTVAVWSLV